MGCPHPNLVSLDLPHVQERGKRPQIAGVRAKGHKVRDPVSGLPERESIWAAGRDPSAEHGGSPAFVGGEHRLRPVSSKQA